MSLTPNDGPQDALRNGIGKTWEAELLISGGALFTLIQATISLVNFMTHALDVGGVRAIGIIMIPYVTVGLIGGFSLHIILRAFWISLVMLQKIYPMGINFEKLNLSEPYLSKAKKFNLNDQILSLDKTSTIIFVFSFAFTLIIVGVFIVAFICMLPMVLGDIWPNLYQNPFFILISVVLMICWCLFIYLDLLTGGFLRRGKYIPKLYYPIYKVFNTLSLGFLWRPIINILFTNAKSKSFLVFAIIGFYIFGLILAGSFADGNKDFVSLLDSRKYEIAKQVTSYRYYVDQQQTDEWSLNPTIQSKIIDEEYLDVFVPYTAFDDGVIDSLNLETKFFSTIVEIKLDGRRLDSLQWIGFKRSNGQSGATSIVSIRNLKTSLHTLTIEVKSKDPFEVPFWKQ